MFELVGETFVIRIESGSVFLQSKPGDSENMCLSLRWGWEALLEVGSEGSGCLLIWRNRWMAFRESR
jgi:hypothetical protein